MSKHWHNRAEQRQQLIELMIDLFAEMTHANSFAELERIQERVDALNPSSDDIREAKRRPIQRLASGLLIKGGQMIEIDGQKYLGDPRRGYDEWWSSMTPEERTALDALSALDKHTIRHLCRYVLRFLKAEEGTNRQN